MPHLGKCEDCEFWEFSFKREYDRFGLCDHPLLADKLLIDVDDERDADEKAIHTDSHFGCIEFTRKGGNVVTRLPKP